MIAENYACAYKEVIEILKYTNKDDVNKIPSDKILLWRDNMKEDYNFEIDEEKPLSEQNISKEARAILANIFKQYWATDYQKERIEAKEKYDMRLKRLLGGKLSYDVFRSEICHMYHFDGDYEFISKVMRVNLVMVLWNNHEYDKALYTLAMIDYISWKNGVMLYEGYAKIP